MEPHDAMSVASHILNEQIARHVLDVLPEHGPVVAIVDRDGSCWPSDPEKLASLHLDAAVLEDYRARIDDGQDLVIAQLGETSVIVAQLATAETNCGYVIIALPDHPSSGLLADAGLAEMLVGQITLIARLIEKSLLLAHAQRSYYSEYGIGVRSVN